MKKAFTLLLALTLAFSIGGCGGSSNKYVKSAKEHGYWHGFGGVSWGMSEEETLEVLGVKRNDTTPILKEELSTNGFVEQKGFKFKQKALGFNSTITFTFGKAINPEAVELTGTEWLYAITVLFDEVQTQKDVGDAIKKELKALKLSYNSVAQAAFRNKQTLKSIADAGGNAKAYELESKLIQPSLDLMQGNPDDHSIENINILGGKNGNAFGVSLEGIGAAMLVLS